MRLILLCLALSLPACTEAKAKDPAPPDVAALARGLRQAQLDFDTAVLKLEGEIEDRLRPARQARTTAATAFALANKADPKCYVPDITTQAQADACRGKAWPQQAQQQAATPPAAPAQ